MGLMRSLLLAGSESRWLRAQATRRVFVRRAVSRFMPGETLEDALGTAPAMQRDGTGLVLTRLAERVPDLREADAVAAHDLDALERIRAGGVDAEIAVQPTELGLDLDPP